MPQARRVTNPARGVSAWCLYDWANSPFPTVVVTFVFSAYFVQAIAADEISGTALWGITMSASAFVVALLSPVLGALADAGGRRKPWLLVFTVGCIIASALLWFAKPEARAVAVTLACVAIGNVFFELCMVFYNAMLADIVPRDRLGRVSGWGWGIGYFGGLTCLIVALFALVQADPPPFGLDRLAAEHVRATGPLVALWFAAFAWPLFLFTPDRPGSGLPKRTVAREGLRRLYETIRDIGQYRTIVHFLLARMLFIDGLNTVFAMGGVFAAGTFGMGVAQVIQFGIALNVTAGLGAIGFGWVDDWIGARRTLYISLSCLAVAGGALISVESHAWFWFWGMVLGIFVGPVQAASRSMMARLAPAHLETEMFGLYALSGKVTAFFGPATVAWVTVLTESQRLGMATVLIFICAGLGLLYLLPQHAED
ncbi:MAG: MFS transporter [Alphaproteobacteria bacterium]|nr:MFS transporter [Alphaproteobacteria bacterium]